MLNPAQRKSLRARAHQLIKVRAAALERDAREQAFSLICRKTGAQPVQQVGKIFVIFRKKPE